MMTNRIFLFIKTITDFVFGLLTLKPQYIFTINHEKSKREQATAGIESCTKIV